MSKGDKLNPIVEAAKLRIFEPRPDGIAPWEDVRAKYATKRSEMSIAELMEYSEFRDKEEDRIDSTSPIRRMSDRAKQKLEEREIKSQIKEGVELANSWVAKEATPVGYREALTLEKVRNKTLEIE